MYGKLLASLPRAGPGVSALILEGLGGAANLLDVDCCATRLRVTVADPGRVDDALLKQSGASCVLRRGPGIQVVYGPQAAVHKSNLLDFIASPQSGPGRLSPPAPTRVKRSAVMAAHMNGTVVPMCQVQDAAFSSCALGDGAAIEPDDGCLYAPADGEINNLFDTCHAIGLVTQEGVEVFLHIGINTVELGGKYFQAHAAVGQKVTKGTLLLSFDLAAVKAAGYLCTTPMIICNTDDCQSVTPVTAGRIQAGAPLLEVTV